jgi:hypothetical protein
MALVCATFTPPANRRKLPCIPAELFVTLHHNHIFESPHSHTLSFCQAVFNYGATLEKAKNQFLSAHGNQIRLFSA